MDFPINTILAGVTFGKRQYYIRKYCRRFTKYELVREPDNKFDKNAIGVVATKHKLHIGYIPKKLASKLSPIMDNGVGLKVGFTLKIFNEKDDSKRIFSHYFLY